MSNRRSRTERSRNRTRTQKTEKSDVKTKAWFKNRIAEIKDKCDIVSVFIRRKGFNHLVELKIYSSDIDNWTEQNLALFDNELNSTYEPKDIIVNVVKNHVDK